MFSSLLATFSCWCPLSTVWPWWLTGLLSSPAGGGSHRWDLWTWKEWYCPAKPTDKNQKIGTGSQRQDGGMGCERGNNFHLLGHWDFSGAVALRYRGEPKAPRYPMWEPCDIRDSLSKSLPDAISPTRRVPRAPPPPPLRLCFLSHLLCFLYSPLLLLWNIVDRFIGIKHHQLCFQTCILSFIFFSPALCYATFWHFMNRFQFYSPKQNWNSFMKSRSS